MNQRALLGVLALAAVALMVSGVLAGRPELPGKPPHEAGLIVEVDSSHGVRVLVHGSGFGLTWITVEPGSKIARLVDGTPRAITVRDLEAGQEVQLWYSGPVRESYPAQADARFILVLR